MPSVPVAAPPRPPTRGLARAAAAALVALLALHLGVARSLGAQERRDAADVAEQPNLIGLFLGGTSTSTTIHLSVGLNFEHQLDERWGLGGFGDVVLGGDEREFLVAPAVFLHPAPALRLAVAPGVEREKAAHETLFVVRFAADYEVAISDRWGILPGVALDLVEGPITSIFVFGAGLGYRF